MRLSFLLCVLLWTVSVSQAATNVFSTQFEATEGYDMAKDLVGQNDWQGEGSGGNGLVDGFFPGQGQHAYVGYSAPTTQDEDQLFVWKPLAFAPLAAKLPVVTFSVLMSIEDSSAANDQYDYFRWSVYNGQASRLFTIEFDNWYRSVAYVLDGTNELVSTEVTFSNNVPYALVVTMDFAANAWSARLDERVIATNQPITTAGLELTLGDIDAIWLIYDAQNPGDNFMVFDKYSVTAGQSSPPRPRLQMLGRTGDGQALLRLTGETGSRFAIDATTNYSTWTALKTNVTSDGYFDYIDVSAAPFKSRFYRGRWVP